MIAAYQVDKCLIPEVLREAAAAGLKAGQNFRPTPMHVQSSGLFEAFDPKKPYETVPDGVCGFAWVNIKPANSPMAHYLKKNKKGSLSYYKGWDVSPFDFGADFNQSMQKKEAWAEAFASVLRKYGFRAYAHSRMD